MVAAPALLLCGPWAWRLGYAPAQLRTTQRRAPHTPCGLTATAGQSLGGRLCIVLLVAGFFLSNWNWFFNPAFTKDEWRQVAAFLRERIKPDEQVVLVSGHAWPVWDYYAPDLPAVRLPDLPKSWMSTPCSISTRAGRPSERRLCRGRPASAAPGSSTGRTKWSIPTMSRRCSWNWAAVKKARTHFYGLTLRRFSSLRPQRFADAPPVEHVLDAHFGDQVILRGYKVLNNGDLLLFWQRLSGGQRPAPGSALGLDDQPLTGRRLPSRPTAGLPATTTRFSAGLPDRSSWAISRRKPGWATIPSRVPCASRLRVYDAQDPAATPLPADGGATTLEVAPVEVIID